MAANDHPPATITTSSRLSILKQNPIYGETRAEHATATWCRTGGILLAVPRITKCPNCSLFFTWRWHLRFNAFDVGKEASVGIDINLHRCSLFSMETGIHFSCFASKKRNLDDVTVKSADTSLWVTCEVLCPLLCTVLCYKPQGWARVGLSSPTLSNNVHPIRRIFFHWQLKHLVNFDQLAHLFVWEHPFRIILSYVLKSSVELNKIDHYMQSLTTCQRPSS